MFRVIYLLAVEHVCQSFLCASRELCIHPSLRCDGVNHCGDNSDEESCRGKRFFGVFVYDFWVTPNNPIAQLISGFYPDSVDNGTARLLGLELTWFVLVSVSCFLAIGAVLAALVICLCRQSASESSDPQQSESFAPLKTFNAAKMLEIPR